MKYIWMVLIVGAGCQNGRAPSNAHRAVKENLQETGNSGQQENLIPLNLMQEQYSDQGLIAADSLIPEPAYVQILRQFQPDLSAFQTFFLTPGQWQTVKGAQGTEITLNPEDFETTGQIKGKLRLHLLELHDRYSMLGAGLHTVSHGRPLESLCAVNLHVSDGVRFLKLKDGARFWVKFPRPGKGNFGIFYSRTGVTGVLESESGRCLLQTEKVLKRDANTFEYTFDTDSLAAGEVKYFRLKGPQLRWIRQMRSGNGYEAEDTIGYEEFSRFVFETIRMKTRGFLIPIGQKWIAVENINGAVARFGTGYRKGSLEIHYSLNSQQDLQEYTVDTYKPIQVDRTGWIQAARFCSNNEVCEVNYTTDEYGGLHSGVLYFVCTRSNTIVMNPWIGDGQGLEAGKFMNIPRGIPAALLAFVYKDGTLMKSYTEFVTGSSDAVTLHFEVMPRGVNIRQIAASPGGL